MQFMNEQFFASRPKSFLGATFPPNPLRTIGAISAWVSGWSVGASGQPMHAGQLIVEQVVKLSLLRGQFPIGANEMMRSDQKTV